LFLSALNTATAVLCLIRTPILTFRSRRRWLYYNLSTGVNAHPKALICRFSRFIS
jgi:hypothetical protein